MKFKRDAIHKNQSALRTSKYYRQDSEIAMPSEVRQMQAVMYNCGNLLYVYPFSSVYIYMLALDVWTNNFCCESYFIPRCGEVRDD
jgi:hypothetical protein